MERLCWILVGLNAITRVLIKEGERRFDYRRRCCETEATCFPAGFGDGGRATYHLKVGGFQK